MGKTREGLQALSPHPLWRKPQLLPSSSAPSKARATHSPYTEKAEPPRCLPSLAAPPHVTDCHSEVPLAFDSAPPEKESVFFHLGLLETSYSYTAVTFPDLQASRGGSELCFTDTKNPPGVTDTAYSCSCACTWIRIFLVYTMMSL